jgi:hypothetical protein
LGLFDKPINVELVNEMIKNTQKNSRPQMQIGYQSVGNLLYETPSDRKTVSQLL